MNSMVKNVFLTLAGAVAAAVLYVLLFGAVNLEGEQIATPDVAGFSYNLSNWKGALWYAAEFIETPISMYYYNYCYTPNVHANDYVDDQLGGIKLGWSNYRNTPANLAGDTDLYDFSGVTSGYWSTGWR